MFEQKGLSLAAWIDIYEKKTKDKVDLPEGYQLLYMAERGFAVIKPDYESKMMIVYETCGDAKFWRDVCELMCCSNGLEIIATICTRHIRPYMRAFGWKLLKEECVNDQYRFICEDSIGRLIIITHKDISDSTGEATYWVTQYLNHLATTDIDKFLASENKGGND